MTTATAFHAAMRDGATAALDGHDYTAAIAGIPRTTANEDYLLGYAFGFDVGRSVADITHTYSVRADGGHGYPYRATCACGWQSRTYAAAHAAHNMAYAHQTDVALDIIDNR